ncbi:MAG: hypothetical protein ACI4SS_03500 [Clostridia bacterium]
MKCPRCGAETDKSKTYCPQCGGELHPRDNSNDDTLRLPDLSGVPLGEPQRRKSSASESKDLGAAKIVIAVCAVIIAIALAVCLAMFMVGGRNTAPIPGTDFIEDNMPSHNVPDLELPGEPEKTPEEKPEEKPEEESEEVPEEKPADKNDIIAEDVTPPEEEPAEEPRQEEPEEVPAEPEDNTSVSTNE